MNLYEVLGLVAIGAGLGGSIGYAGSTEHSPLRVTVAVAVGVIAGVIAFLRIRRTVIHLKQPTERTLAILYVLTFFGVLLATWVAAFGTLSIAANLNR